MASVEKDLMNQSPDTDQLNVGARDREESRMATKFLSRVFEAVLLATHSTARNTTLVHIQGDMEGCSYWIGQMDKVYTGGERFKRSSKC